MKKVLIIWLAAVLGLSVFAEGEMILAASSTDIGVYKFEAPAGATNIIIPVQFKALAYDKDDIPVNELIKFKSLSNGDHLIMFNGTGYDGWTFKSGAWSADTTYSIVSPTVSGGKSASSTYAPVGQALWLVRSNAVKSDIVIYGKYVETSAMTSTIVRAKWNLLANPTGDKITGANLMAMLSATRDSSKTICGPQIGDKIVIVKNTGIGRTYIYSTTTKNGEGWYRGGTKQVDAFDADLEATEGFWYYAKNGSGNTTFAWEIGE